MSTAQTPIDSGFGAASTAADVIKGIDLSGRTAIVTGGYSGIGVETVRALRSAGARVVVPARNRDKAAAELEGIDGLGVGTASGVGDDKGVGVDSSIRTPVLLPHAVKMTINSNQAKRIVTGRPTRRK
jgi:NAD(P)-dependent dehydrogenase (short-subunit alcohol dehydrogenase family)